MAAIILSSEFDSLATGLHPFRYSRRLQRPYETILNRRVFVVVELSPQEKAVNRPRSLTDPEEISELGMLRRMIDSFSGERFSEVVQHRIELPVLSASAAMCLESPPGTARCPGAAWRDSSGRRARQSFGVALPVDPFLN